MLRRRRPPSPAMEPFLAMASEIDRAQRSLLAAVPTPRDEGIPLAAAIAGFDDGIRAARALMPHWRTPETAALHDACTAALAAAAEEAERLRLEPGRLSFEALNGRIGDVLHPLEVFADAERALRRGLG